MSQSWAPPALGASSAAASRRALPKAFTRRTSKDCLVQPLALISGNWSVASDPKRPKRKLLRVVDESVFWRSHQQRRNCEGATEQLGFQKGSLEHCSKRKRLDVGSLLRQSLQASKALRDANRVLFIAAQSVHARLAHQGLSDGVTGTESHPHAHAAHRYFA